VTASTGMRAAQARALVADLPDPEIPVLTLEDLGILREVSEQDGQLLVLLTPTYTGCPATEAIRDDVQRALLQAGFHDAQVRVTLAPPWSSDWISARGRRRLREYGIAPPACLAEPVSPSASTTSTTSTQILQFMPRHASNTLNRSGVLAGPSTGDAVIACPQCDSTDTELLASHGSTPCKALYRCRTCREPFDYFKPY
jgi:ring-1,2-phenylacetyl-CoA epoxidase subunit PaaD